MLALTSLRSWTAKLIAAKPRLSPDGPRIRFLRAVTSGGVMVGFVIGLIEPDHTGHVTP